MTRMREVTAALGGRFAFGGDYNPEQWPRGGLARRRPADARGRRQPGQRRHLLLGAARAGRGHRTTSAGSTACSTCCTTHGIARRPRHRDRVTAAVVLPPRTRRSLPVDRGRRARCGSAAAQAFCPSSPAYRAAARALARRWPSATRDHPAVVHVARQQRVRLPQLRLLLRRRADGVPRTGCAASTATIDALNEAWGTAFWCQRYADFEEIAAAAGRPDTSATRPSSWTSGGSPRRAARRFRGRARTSCGRSRPAARSPPTSWAHFRRARLLALGRRAGPRLQRPLPDRRRTPTTHSELAFSARPDALARRWRPLAADGALHIGA